MTDRQKLEAKQKELIRVLSSGEHVLRDGIVTQLRDTIDTLAALDNGGHFTQVQGDTLAKIVSRELSLIVPVQVAREQAQEKK